MWQQLRSEKAIHPCSVFSFPLGPWLVSNLLRQYLKGREKKSDWKSRNQQTRGGVRLPWNWNFLTQKLGFSFVHNEKLSVPWLQSSIRDNLPVQRALYLIAKPVNGELPWQSKAARRSRLHAKLESLLSSLLTWNFSLSFQKSNWNFSQVKLEDFWELSLPSNPDFYLRHVVECRRSEMEIFSSLPSLARKTFRLG